MMTGDVLRREVITLGTINDGIEADFPGSDVPRYRGLVKALFVQETDRDVAAQMPDYWVYQDGMFAICLLRNANLAVMGGIDLNSSSALSISDETKLSWYPPYRSSIVGLLASGSVFIDGVNQMPATGEHAPVVALGRVPVRA
jgi:hypothetical protein